MVDEARDHFFAGAGLASQEHRCLGMSDPRGMRQDVFPLLRLSDDTPLTAPCLEFAGQRRDLGLEARRRFARLRLAARRFSEPLMREGECQVIRDAPGEIDVVLTEAVGLPREEEQRSKDFSSKRHQHAKRRSDTEATKDLAAQAGRRHFRVGVMDDISVPMQLREVVAAQRLRLVEISVRACAGHRIDAEGRAVGPP